MNRLRKYIRELLSENYKLTDKDVSDIRDYNQDFDPNARRSGWSDKQIKLKWDQRGKGWQGSQSIARDKAKMREWHKLMKTPEGKKIVKDFQNGNIQIMHDISYQGAYTSKFVSIVTGKPCKPFPL